MKDIHDNLQSPDNFVTHPKDSFKGMDEKRDPIGKIDDSLQLSILNAVAMLFDTVPVKGKLLRIF